MEAVRGRELEAFDRSIDVHMGRIRAAIEADVKNPKRILTVRGVGYVLREPLSAGAPKEPHVSETAPGPGA
jgi:DNA-binding response OmpR family regulator